MEIKNTVENNTNLNKNAQIVNQSNDELNDKLNDKLNNKLTEDIDDFLDFDCQNLIDPKIWHIIGKALYENNINNVVYFGLFDDENTDEE
jgi:hypothetical protein